MKTIYTKDGIKEILDRLEKNGFVYQGFDKLNFCDLFIKQEDWKIERVEIDPNGISFEGFRIDNERFKRESTPIRLYNVVFEEFKKIYDYIYEKRCLLPEEFAKNQKELDRAYKWEMGIDTYCKVEGNSIVCGVKDDE